MLNFMLNAYLAIFYNVKIVFKKWEIKRELLLLLLYFGAHFLKASFYGQFFKF